MNQDNSNGMPSVEPVETYMRLTVGEEMTNADWEIFVNIGLVEVEHELHIVGYWDMGTYGEHFVMARNDDEATEMFEEEYEPLTDIAPYIARIETEGEQKARINSGDISMPSDGQTDRFNSAKGMYYEALYN